MLKPYDKEDFKDIRIFREEKCSVCGHHLPIDQSFRVGEDWVHNDVRICLALIKEKGYKTTITPNPPSVETASSPDPNESGPL